jgi:hypothetical protein
MREIFKQTTACQGCGRCCSHTPVYDDDYLVYYIAGTFEDMVFDFGKNTCMFLSSNGCIIDENLRPFACVQHTCSNLYSELKEFKLIRKLGDLKNQLISHRKNLEESTQRYRNYVHGYFKVR